MEELMPAPVPALTKAERSNSWARDAEAMRGECSDRAESLQPEQLLLQRADESPSLETPGNRCPLAAGRRTGSTRC
jgi:hypothetical protein